MTKEPKGPTAPRRCSNATCYNFFPCEEHPWGWRADRIPALTHGERKLMKTVKQKADYKCFKCGTRDPDGETDHIINRARGGTTTLDNLQFLCRSCHKRKTQKESGIAQKRKKRPQK